MAPALPLFGRWHLDARNSFFLSETGLAGLLELSRLAKVPVQKLARTSPGTAITYLQLERALSEGILVPWKKGEPERWKTAWDLLVADKGGLVYEPLLGLYEGVGEIDFASMYPSLMVHHNISPETVGCACCPEAATPEIGISTCRKREGLVTKTLRPILARRARLKGLRDGAMGEARDLLDARQNALKWILVCCFGYLGYRNARFGRIEAHEAVTAHSRETLLTAMAIAEGRGFRALHAIVDSLWLQKPGATEADYATLCAAIREATGIPIALEGIYKWIAFLPSRTHPGVGVPNRFVGALPGGGLKIRGIEQRRSDTPAFVREAQEAMLAVLARAEGAAGFRAAVPAVLEVLAEAAARLREGRVPVEALTISKTVSQEAGAYRTNSLVALASRQMAAAGVPVHPGEQVRYVITGFDKHDAGERVRALPLLTPDLTYDAAKYLEMLLEAAATLLQPAGITPAAIRQALGLPPARPGHRRPRTT
jgi:DNA polymerase elongation subunit (family B)